MTRYLSYKQAAAYLALPEGTLRSLVHRKEIPHFRISERKVTFDPNDLDEWLRSRRQPANDQVR